MSHSQDDPLKTGEPHSARIYNYWLGGKDNCPADREMGDQILSVLPMIGEMAVQNRAFLRRTVRFLAAERCLRPCLDIGTGLPTADNTHERAQSVAPESKIVYVDNDPLVLTHARALLTNSPEGRTDYVDADLRDPATILREATKTLDLSRPVGLTLLGVVFHIPDDSAYTLVQELVNALAPGSYLTLTHSTNAVTVEAMEEAVRQWNESASVSIRLRTPKEVERFFEGMEMVDPGLASIPLRRRDHSEIGEPQPIDEFGAVARKP